MGYEAIKLELIEWLTKLEDEDTIQYLRIVKENSIANNDWWDALPVNVKNGIKQSQQDKIDGRVTSHEEVLKKYGRNQKD